MLKNTKKFKRIIKSTVGLIIVFVICTGAVYDSAGIDIVITEINNFTDTENTINVRTKSETIADILAENNIETSVYDKINEISWKTLSDGDEIVITKGLPVTITCDGVITATSTVNKTVSEALAETGFTLENNDYSVPSADAAITENMNIVIIRVDNKVEEREETVPYTTIYKEDNSLYEGQEKVSVKGVNGIIRITENVVYENGTEISRTENSRETITEKIDEVILKGTKKKVAVQKAKNTQKSAAEAPSKTQTTPSGLNYKKKLTMNATTYSAFKKGGGYGITASGRTARYGVVAVDPKVIPLGTNLYIEGYGYAVAADTGGAIKGNKIDLCFEESNSELRKFGRKNVTVYILD